MSLIPSIKEAKNHDFEYWHDVSTAIYIISKRINEILNNDDIDFSKIYLGEFSRYLFEGYRDLSLSRQPIIKIRELSGKSVDHAVKCFIDMGWDIEKKDNEEGMVYYLISFNREV